MPEISPPSAADVMLVAVIFFSGVAAAGLAYLGAVLYRNRAKRRTVQQENPGMLRWSPVTDSEHLLDISPLDTLDCLKARVNVIRPARSK